MGSGGESDDEYNNPQLISKTPNSSRIQKDFTQPLNNAKEETTEYGVEEEEFGMEDENPGQENVPIIYKPLKNVVSH